MNAGTTQLLHRFRQIKDGKKPRIIFPEGEDPRIREAAERLAHEGLLTPVLVAAGKFQLPAGVEFVDILEPETRGHVRLIADHRAAATGKIFSDDMLRDPLMVAALLTGAENADGMVAGVQHPTSEVLRAVLRGIGTAPGIETLSSCFVMIFPEDCPAGGQVLLFADCAVVIEPTASQLSDIALATAQTASNLLNLDPRVAFLSFSTRGSAQHGTVDLVKEALKITRERQPDLTCDGELQFDAAIIPDIANRKAPGSPLEGAANVLIFPHLDAGNIAYKLAERLASADAIGPLLQGIARPACDLSRGANVDDIINAAWCVAAQGMGAGKPQELK